MKFNIKREGKKDRSVEFKELEELMAFIMGCDCPVLIIPDWQSKSWDMEVKKDVKNDDKS